MISSYERELSQLKQQQQTCAYNIKDV